VYNDCILSMPAGAENQQMSHMTHVTSRVPDTSVGASLHGWIVGAAGNARALRRAARAGGWCRGRPGAGLGGGRAGVGDGGEGGVDVAVVAVIGCGAAAGAAAASAA